MSARAIWEATGKDLINRNLNYSDGVAKCRFAVFDNSVSWSQLVQQEPWLETEVNFLPSLWKIQGKHVQRLNKKNIQNKCKKIFPWKNTFTCD